MDNTIVVRFSGGQQSGHTVKIGKQMHTHSNFGAGSLRGKPSYFSEHCTMYPVTMMRERKVLIEKTGHLPKVYYHPMTMVTTPFDRYANRNCEETKEHGTCGLGIGKTMKRNEGPLKLYAIDLINEGVVLDKLASITEYYMGTNGNLDDWLGDELVEWWEAVKTMPKFIADYSFLNNYSNIIFEGSQGVLLDMTHGNFPFVTYSNTTSKNAQEICNKLGIGDRTVYHITRAYSTRHGNGPFEQKAIKLKNNEDENCTFNEWQGDFKVAPMNYNLLNYAIAVENIYSSGCKRVLVVTCNDQVEVPFDMNKLTVGYDKVLKSNSPISEKMLVHERMSNINLED